MNSNNFMGKIFQAAISLHELTASLQEVGYTRQEAMYLTAEYLKASAANG
jgi:hypothetical protein